MKQRMFNLKNSIAKFIICHSPPSVELRYELFGRLPRAISRWDEMLQGWAIECSDIFSETDWQEVQLQKLKSLFLHAYQNVEFWRTTFRKARFNPETMGNFSELALIPITTRRMISATNQTFLRARNIPPY